MMLLEIIACTKRSELIDLYFKNTVPDARLKMRVGARVARERRKPVSDHAREVRFMVKKVLL
jgi:hypothetical protein